MRIRYISTFEFTDAKEGLIKLNPYGIQFDTGTPVFYCFSNGVIGQVASIVNEALTDNQGFGLLQWQADQEAKSIQKKFEDGSVSIFTTQISIFKREDGVATRWKVAGVFMKEVVQSNTLQKIAAE